MYFTACQKIVQQRLSSSTSCLTPTNSRPSTPSNHTAPVPLPAVAPRQPQQVVPSPTNNGFLTGSSPASNAVALGSGPGGGGAVLASSPSHAQTLSHKVCFILLPKYCNDFAGRINFLNYSFSLYLG